MNRNIAVICAAIIIKTIERCLTAEHKGIYHLNEASGWRDSRAAAVVWGSVWSVFVCVALLTSILCN